MKKFSDLGTFQFILLEVLVFIVAAIIIAFLNGILVPIIKELLISMGFNSQAAIASIITANVSFFVAILSATALIYSSIHQSNKAAVSSLHSESGWRKDLLKILDNPEWNLVDLESIKNRINLENLVNPEEFKSLLSQNKPNFTRDFFLDKLIVSKVSELNIILINSNQIPYKETITLRQLLRMKLKNDWLLSQGKDILYKDKSSITDFIKVDKNIV